MLHGQLPFDLRPDLAIFINIVPLNENSLLTEFSPALFQV